MKTYSIAAGIFIAALLTSFCCSDKSTGSATLDTTVVGKWQGAIAPINITMPPLVSIKFKGAKIFANIYKSDSSFALISRDTTRAAIPVIKDTTLVMTGTWRLNPGKDTILLVSDSCVVVDTSLNVLTQKPVQGQIIPIPVKINKQENGAILWQVDMADLAPVAPLIGLNISTIPPNVIIIELEKKSQ